MTKYIFLFFWLLFDICSASSTASLQTTVIQGVAVISPLGSTETATGWVTFSQTPMGGTIVVVNITNIATNPSAEHGIHIHEFGDIRGFVNNPVPGSAVAEGLSVGGHYNPDMFPHGCPSNTTQHVGDLGNWQATNGVIYQTKTIPWLVLDGTAKSIIGRAVVLHATTDDCVTVPSSGSRLAVGIIGIANGPNTNSAKPSSGHSTAVCVLQGTSNCQGTCGLGKMGIVTFTNDPTGGVSVVAQVNFQTTEVGFHIHTYGDLRTGDGTSVGGHLNPDGHMHGLPGVVPQRHLGDLGTIKTFSGGNGYYNFRPTYNPAGSWNVDGLVGRAVVVHQNIDHGDDSTCGDDGTTTGAAGKRILFCVIGIPNTANQTNPANYLPTPQIPSGLTFDNVWHNTPCVVAPIDLKGLGFNNQQAFTSSLTLFWKPITSYDQTITMAVRGSTVSGWVGVGWTGGTYQMIGSDAVIGWGSDARTVAAYSLNGKDVSEVVKNPSLPVNDTYSESVNGITTIIFTRTLASGQHPLKAKGANVMIAARGDNPYLSQHNEISTTAVAIDYSTGEAIIITAINLADVHGALMVFAWSIILPFGAMFARYGKDFPENNWFKVHVAAQSIGYVTACAGFIVALVMVDGSHFKTIWHGQLGLTLIILGFFQICAGILRPKAPSRDNPKVTTARLAFEYGHPWGGRLLLITGIIQVYGGLAEHNVSGGWVFLYTVVVIVVIVVTIVLEIRPRDDIRERLAVLAEKYLPGSLGDKCSSCLVPLPLVRI